MLETTFLILIHYYLIKKISKVHVLHVRYSLKIKWTNYFSQHRLKRLKLVKKTLGRIIKLRFENILNLEVVGMGKYVHLRMEGRRCRRNWICHKIIGPSTASSSLKSDFAFMVVGASLVMNGRAPPEREIARLQ
jgi:hypothetical protein